MAETSMIEWTDATWNPITGCTLVSEGCRHCYAATLAATRLKHHPSREGLARINAAGEAKFTGEVRLNEDWLDQPLRWRRPRRIFVCAHGDLFHENVPDEWIDRVFAVMALASQHTFQVLTKRPDRAREYLTMLQRPCREREIKDAGRKAGALLGDMPLLGRRITALPLPNVWLGTSVEDQATADARIPHLLATPAAVRFVSAEPLLGPVDLTRVGSLLSVEAAFPDLVDRIRRRIIPHTVSGMQIEALGTPHQAITYFQTPDHMGGFEVGSRRYPRLDWVIVGGESGRNARPMHPDWARDLRDQCAEAGTPFFFKQHGMWLHESQDRFEEWDWGDAAERNLLHRLPDGTVSMRLRKGDAGRLLDGIEWNGMPSNDGRAEE